MCIIRNIMLHIVRLCIMRRRPGVDMFLCHDAATLSPIRVYVHLLGVVSALNDSVYADVPL
jgi:hypothetical protein